MGRKKADYPHTVALIYTLTMSESIYNATVKSEVNATKEGGALFGPKGGVKPSTKKFLKKGDGNTIRMTAAAPATRKGSYQPTVLAPPVSARTAKSVQQYVPRHTEKATLAPRSSKEFVKTNRMEAVGTTARRVPSAYIDKVSGSGGRFGKGESGLKPKYVKTAKYGKTPKYLTQQRPPPDHPGRAWRHPGRLACQLGVDAQGLP